MGYSSPYSALYAFSKSGLEPLRSLRRSSVLQLGVRCVAFQTIPAVAAQEGNCQTDALSLSQDLTDFLIVVGAEHHFGSLAQNGGQLGLVVYIALGVGLLIDDGAAQLSNSLTKFSARPSL